MVKNYHLKSTVLKNIFAFFALILIGFYFYFGFKGFDFVKIWNSFCHTDFYINYAGGFVRRGFDGEILYKFSKFSHLNALILQKIYNLIFLVLFWILIIYFIFKYRPPFFVLFSTSILLLFVFYLGRGVRKDHILMVFFMLSCFNIVKSRHKILTLVITNLLFVVASLIHELFFIISFFPTVVLLKNFIYDKEQKIGYVKSAVSLLPATLVFFYILFFGLGTTLQQDEIITSWKSVGVQNISFNSGIFNRSLYIWELGFTRNQYFTFIVAIAMHFVFMVIMISNNLKNKELKLAFYILILLQYGALMLLCIVAKDFSRWIFLCNFTTLVPICILKREISRYNTYESETSYSFFRKIAWIPYILFFINTMPHSGWSFNDYTINNPIHNVYKIITNKQIF